MSSNLYYGNYYFGKLLSKVGLPRKKLTKFMKILMKKKLMSQIIYLYIFLLY